MTKVDDDVINQARAWLIRQQRADGSWAADNYADNKRRTALLTAYIARVLAMTASSIHIERNFQ